MSWQDELIPSLRLLIDDFVEPYTYSDDRLSQTAVAASQMMLGEIKFDNEYTANVSSTGITPDPSNEDDFIYLLTLKTACFIAQSELKTAAKLGGISVNDGPSTISTNGRAANAKVNADSVCGEYYRARQNYLLGNSRAGKAILGPYTVEYIQPKRS